ncbi:UDP-N-acetylglucosamine 1-carboxyvinyltransferase [bacterium]|nr:UDP-N-acetylglucosamine 1-carboxyvinyltransferase [bacterium]
MDKFVIEKSPPLSGVVRTGGAKNSCLPLMAAALLTDSPLELGNVPDLMDVRTMTQVLQNLGVNVERKPGWMRLDASAAEGFTAPYDLVRRMRASYYVLGPLVARKARAEVSLPGGCAIGQRAMDLHLKGLAALGASIDTSRGYIHAHAEGGLQGARVDLSGPRGSSVGATINVMLAASLARGVTVIENAAREPEIWDMAELLNKMGARVSGAGGNEITIEGVRALGGAVHRVIPDRIEAGTFAVAAAITGGDILIEDCCPVQMEAVLALIEAAGATLERSENSLRVTRTGELRPFDICTAPYPGFPTDMQAQFCALATQANGPSSICETIFENRFLHVPELARLGARMEVSGQQVTIQGPTPLSHAPVMASDLRASAALVLAALVAEGGGEISRIYHLDRGYENLEAKLTRLGAHILRISE